MYMLLFLILNSHCQYIQYACSQFVCEKNGKRIVDRVALENFWDKSGLQPLARADQIELQHHGSELFFKNLYVRELSY